MKAENCICCASFQLNKNSFDSGDPAIKKGTHMIEAHKI